MNEILDCVFSNPTNVVTIVTSIVTIMGIVAATFPGVGSNPYWNVVRKIIDVLALNIGNAKNTDRNTKP